VLTGGVCISLINERLKVPVYDVDASVATDTGLSEPDPSESIHVWWVDSILIFRCRWAELEDAMNCYQPNQVSPEVCRDGFPRSTHLAQREETPFA